MGYSSVVQLEELLCPTENGSYPFYHLSGSPPASVNSQDTTLSHSHDPLAFPSSRQCAKWMRIECPGALHHVIIRSQSSETRNAARPTAKPHPASLIAEQTHWKYSLRFEWRRRLH